MIGSAAAGDGGVVLLNTALNCSVLMRRRTFSWATIMAPALAMFSLPPAWSPCQCVFTTNRTGFAVTVAIAALILAVSGAYWSSMTNASS